MRTRKVTLILLMVISLMILFMACPPEAEAASKLKTITVTKIDQQTAKKVHKQLLKGKKFKLRFRGNKKAFYKKFQKLSQKVANCTDVGLDIFPICATHTEYFGVSGNRQPTEIGNYTVLTVYGEYCQEYIYGIKFAERELKDFRAYIDKVLHESEELYDALNAGTVYIDEADYKSKRALTEDTKKTIASLRELSKYLKKTKFRNLSEAMKARIMLEVGPSYKGWGKPSMRYEERAHGHKDTFKALYQKKAYGRCSTYATVACKICAVFHIGEFDYASGKLYGATHAVAQIKVKTYGGKIRYAIVDNGAFGTYNSFAGYKILDLPGKYRRQHNKKMKPIKKIDTKTKQLKQINLLDRREAGYSNVNSKSFDAYLLDVPKSEW